MLCIILVNNQHRYALRLKMFVKPFLKIKEVSKDFASNQSLCKSNRQSGALFYTKTFQVCNKHFHMCFVLIYKNIYIGRNVAGFRACQVTNQLNISFVNLRFLIGARYFSSQIKGADFVLIAFATISVF